jgi:hypothetical protein
MGGNIFSLGLLKVFKCNSRWRPFVGKVEKMLLPKFLFNAKSNEGNERKVVGEREGEMIRKEGIER